MADVGSSIRSNAASGDVWYAGYSTSPTFTYGYGTHLLSITNNQGWIGRYNANNLSVTALVNISAVGGGGVSVGALDVDGTNTIPGDGSVYFIGGFTAKALTLLGVVNATFNSDKSAAGFNEDIYVGKVYHNLTLAWITSFGYNFSHDRGQDIAVSSTGDAVYIGAYYSGPILAMGSTILSNDNYGYANNEAVVAKLSATTGAVIWAVRLHGTGDDYVRSVTVDRSSAFGSTETIIVTGGTNSSTFVAGSFSLLNGGSYDAFVVRMDGATGMVLNATLVGGSSNDVTLDVDIHDTTGNIYLTGFISSTSITFGGTTYTRTGAAGSVMVAKLGADLSQKWIYMYSNNGNDLARASSLDQATETLYVAATLGSTGVTFASVTTTERIVIFAINSAGQVVDAVQFATTPINATNNQAYAIDVDAKGNVWVAGSAVTSNAVSIGGIPYTNYGGTSDAFAALYNSALDPLWEPLV